MLSRKAARDSKGEKIIPLKAIEKMIDEYEAPEKGEFDAVLSLSPDGKIHSFQNITGKKSTDLLSKDIMRSMWNVDLPPK